MIGDDRPPGDDRARTFQPLVPPCPRILPTPAGVVELSSLRRTVRKFRRARYAFTHAKLSLHRSSPSQTGGSHSANRSIARSRCPSGVRSGKAACGIYVAAYPLIISLFRPSSLDTLPNSSQPLHGFVRIDEPHVLVARVSPAAHGSCRDLSFLEQETRRGFAIHAKLLDVDQQAPTPVGRDHRQSGKFLEENVSALLPFLDSFRKAVFLGGERGRGPWHGNPDLADDVCHTDPGNVVHERGRPDDPPHPPANHAIFLGDTPDGDGSFGHSWEASRMKIGPAVEQDPLERRVIQQPGIRGLTKFSNLLPVPAK